MIADALALYDFLQKNKDKYETLGAMFKPDGHRIEGNQKVEVEIVKSSQSNIWFYRVKPVKDYVFMPIPVTVCYISYATQAGSTNPNSEVFRFVDNPMATFTSGGVPNLEVNFSIIGYMPKQLLSRLESK